MTDDPGNSSLNATIHRAQGLRDASGKTSPSTTYKPKEEQL